MRACSACSLSIGMGSSKSSEFTKRQSTSHPDLSQLCISCDAPGQQMSSPDHVIRVFRADQSCCYLPIHRSTTAREVVMLALNEFRVNVPSE